MYITRSSHAKTAPLPHVQHLQPLHVYSTPTCVHPHTLPPYGHIRCIQHSHLCIHCTALLQYRYSIYGNPQHTMGWACISKPTVTEFNQLAFELNLWDWASRSSDTIQLPSSVAYCMKRGYKECSIIINFLSYEGPSRLAESVSQCYKECFHHILTDRMDPF